MQCNNIIQRDLPHTKIKNLAYSKAFRYLSKERIQRKKGTSNRTKKLKLETNQNLFGIKIVEKGLLGKIPPFL